MEIIVGAIVTILVQLFKKLVARIGSNWTILLVAALTFLGAYGWSLVKDLQTTQQLLSSWGTIASYQFAIWALFVKWIWPQVKDTFGPGK